MERQRYYNRPKPCEWCGKTFYASRYDAKYCGDNCRKNASRQPARVRRAKLRAEQAIHGYLSMLKSDDQYQSAIDDLIALLQSNSLVK